MVRRRPSDHSNIVFGNFSLVILSGRFQRLWSDGLRLTIANSDFGNFSLTAILRASLSDRFKTKPSYYSIIELWN